MSVEIVVPELGESVLEATVARWFKKEGERVEIGEPVVELETDKVNLEVGAEKAGVLVRIEKGEDEDVEVGDILGMIEEGEGEVEPEPDVDEQAPTEEEELVDEPTKESPEEEKEVEELITPVAKRLAEDKGIAVAELTGTGAGGRITKEDVQRQLQDLQVEKQPERELERKAERIEPEAEREEVFATRREERVRMSRRRRTIASRLVDVQHTAAMLTTFNEIDMGAVMDLRKRRNPAFQEQHGFKLGITSFFIKASIGALKKFPRLNAEIQGEEMVLKHYYDIGVAIGAEEGLVVPVLRDADRMSFAEIERQIKDFVDKTEQKTLALEELRGGSFTITNGGVFGSLLSTPILNPPQVSILGLHKIESRPIVVEDEMVIRPMMYVALSYDHRIVDGREAVQFLVRVKELVEDPEELLLEG